MALNVSVDTSILDADVTGFNRALASLQKALGQYSTQAPKIAACYLCDALRARTKKAPKYPKRAEWKADPFKPSGFVEVHRNGRVYKVPTPSPYVTRRGQIIHRYYLTKHVGTPNATTFPVGVYHATKTTKRGKVVTNKSAEMAEIKRNHLAIRNRGLAQKSWNWAKRDIAKRGKVDGYKMRKGDRRNPKDSVSGFFRKLITMGKTEGVARIVNRLDYIISSLKTGAVDEALKKTAAKLAWKSGLAQGMSVDEAARYAKDLVDSLPNPSE